MSDIKELVNCIVRLSGEDASEIADSMKKLRELTADGGADRYTLLAALRQEKAKLDFSSLTLHREDIQTASALTEDDFKAAYGYALNYIHAFESNAPYNETWDAEARRWDVAVVRCPERASSVGVSDVRQPMSEYAKLIVEARDRAIAERQEAEKRQREKARAGK